MKIAFVHYLIGDRSGVNSVMSANISSIKKMYKNVKIILVGKYIRDISKDKDIHYVDAGELDISKDKKKEYSKEDIYMYMEHGEQIYNKLKVILRGFDYVVFENPTLGINPSATYCFYRFAKKNAALEGKTKVIFRIHDFAEDRGGNFIDLLKFSGKESSPYWHQIIFPKLKNLGYIVINSVDVKRMHGHGLVEENKVSYLPNPVDESLLQKDAKTSEKLRELLIEKENLPKDIKFIFYPVRIVPRKNVEEAILLTTLINYHFNENYHLLVSLRKKSQEHYAAQLERFIKKHKLPATIGINEHVTLHRTYKGKKLKTFGIGDAYNICDKVITTSLLEGFGMFFIESWYHNKAIFGRDLPAITHDFKKQGINLEHLYSALFINKKDYKDIKDLNEKLKIIAKLKNREFREEVYEENKHQLEGIFRLFNKDYEKKLIKENRKQVMDHYTQDKIARRFMKILKAVE